MTPAISVVIPTWQRPGLLARCLTAVLAQDLPYPYEVVVVDDEPAEATRRVVAFHLALLGTREAVPGAVPGETAQASNAAPDVTLRYLPVERNGGPAAARNLGWRAARGPVIAFTDDDCLPDHAWLRTGLAAVEDGADAASGRLVVPRPASPTDYEATTAHLEHSPFATANCFYRRSVLEAVGGFDERFRTAWREDSDLYFRVEEAGFAAVQVPDAVVVHPVRRAPWGISLREQRKSLYNALLYRKHPARYRRDIQRRPPLRYYGVLGALALAAAGVAGRSAPVASLGAIAWFAQTAWLAGSRLRGTSHAPAHVVEMTLTSALIPLLSVYWRLRGAARFRVLFV